MRLMIAALCLAGPSVASEPVADVLERLQGTAFQDSGFISTFSRREAFFTVGGTTYNVELSGTAADLTRAYSCEVPGVDRCRADVSGTLFFDDGDLSLFIDQITWAATE